MRNTVLKDKHAAKEQPRNKGIQSILATVRGFILSAGDFSAFVFSVLEYLLCLSVVQHVCLFVWSFCRSICTSMCVSVPSSISSRCISNSLKTMQRVVKTELIPELQAA